ncbi:MAG TPA: hypothetical protein VFL99_15620, partial [Segeticoccus sp.]|uniref:hypothetical protein n=1 Tax=Segeticoccus sp. TaxID=2706531 RepID=UPI002D80AF3B
MTYVPADTPVVPEWWPAPDTAADTEYASRTYGVVRWVYRQHCHKLYPASVDNCAELRADLLSWLIVRAMEFRAQFVPDPARFKPGEPDPQLTQWLQVLRAAMTKAVKWHYNNTQVPAGLHPLEARTPAYSTRSVEEPARANGSSSTRATLREGDVRTLGDIGHALWYAGEPLQPERHYLAVEGMWEAVGRLTGENRTGSYEQAVHAL